MEQAASILTFLFSFNDDIRRFQWWILQVIGTGTIGVLTQLQDTADAAHPNFILSGLFMLGMVLAIWVLLSANARRFHAFDKSGWNNLWLFMPLIGPLYILYACGIKSENA